MKIIIYGPLITGYIGKLKTLIDFPCYFKEYYCKFSNEEFLKDLDNADVLITMELPKLKPFPKNIKLIQIPGGGTDKIDFSSIPNHVSVCTAPQHGDSIAEYTIMCMLVLIRNLKRIETSFKQNSWKFGIRCGGPLGKQLKNRKIGILGYGEIGKALAKKLKAFDSQVYICNRSNIKNSLADKFFNISNLNNMISEVDFLVIAIALTDETKNIINKDRLALMKKDAILINISRGECVEEESLFDVCNSKKIAGAIIDVWYRYPELGETLKAPSRFPFSKLKNVIMTPHISAWTEEVFEEKIEVIANNIKNLEKEMHP